MPWHDVITAVRVLGRSLLCGGQRALFCPQCLVCGRLPDGYEPVPVCAACAARLGTSRRRCPRCAQAVPDGVPIGPRCGECRSVPLRFDRALAAGQYAGPLRAVVLRMKQRIEEPLALAAGELLAERLGPALDTYAAELVVPMPMHWSRRLARGTNSPELLAEVLARRLDLPCARWCLTRRRATAQQTGLTPRQRRANVRGAFRVRRPATVAGRHVLLVDDVLTTGSTASAAARALRQAGAREVTLAVLARAGLAAAAAAVPAGAAREPQADRESPLAEARVIR